MPSKNRARITKADRDTIAETLLKEENIVWGDLVETSQLYSIKKRRISKKRSLYEIPKTVPTRGPYKILISRILMLGALQKTGLHDIHDVSNMYITYMDSGNIAHIMTVNDIPVATYILNDIELLHVLSEDERSFINYLDQQLLDKSMYPVKKIYFKDLLNKKVYRNYRA